MNIRYERLLVLGNGPSLKEEYFPLLGSTPCLGMNAAYRYWERINWYPNYYCCLDDQLILTHADAIRSLLEENRCERFFLHHDFFRAHPDLAGDERILCLAQVLPGSRNAERCARLGLEQESGPAFRSSARDKLTTGAYAVRFGYFLGYRSIGLVGVDCRYVERIPESRAVDDIVLEIEETPAENPNYFFSDYQAAGDRYNLPNPEVHAGNLHLQSFEALRNDVEESALDLSVYVCTQESELHERAVFPYVPLPRFLSGAFLSAVMMPLTMGEAAIAVRRFELWTQDGYRPYEAAAAAPSVDLYLCFNSESDAKLEEKIRDAFEQAGLDTVFRRLVVCYSGLSGLRDLYNPARVGRHGPDGYSAGPNNQFFDIIQRFSVGMARIMLMETDVLPLRNGWLAGVERAASDTDRFWFCGSQYRGAASVESFWHINGNALYSVGDPAFRDFFDEVFLPHYRERVRKQPALSYDVVLHDLFLDLFSGDRKPSDLQRWGEYAHRIRFSDFIVNVSHEVDRRPKNQISLQEARSRYPESVLFHGAVAFMDDQLERQSALQSDSAQLVYIDCDIVDEWGHHLAYARNVASTAEAFGLKTTVLGARTLDRSLMQRTSLDLRPVFSGRSHVRGGPQQRRFGKELAGALNKLRRGKADATLFVYMYTAGLEHLEEIAKLVAADSRLFATVNIFHSFSDETDDTQVSLRVGELLGAMNANHRLSISVPTEAVAERFQISLGLHPAVAPHPSTTFSDDTVVELLAKPPHSLESDRACVLFPGGVSKEKGFPLTVAAVESLVERSDVECIVRAVVRDDTPAELATAAARLGALGLELSDAVLEERAYQALLERADVFVLPYLASSFARRTSGMVVDALLLGRPFVALEGTWLGDFAVRTGAGVAVSATGREIVSGIDAILADYNRYAGNAVRARESYLQRNSWKALVDSVVLGQAQSDQLGADSSPGETAKDEKNAVQATDFHELLQTALGSSATGDISAEAIDTLADQLRDISERLRKLEQARDAGARSMAAARSSREATARSLDPDLVTGNFSLVIYLENIFRNRPVLLRGLHAVHNLLSRLLKLP